MRRFFVRKQMSLTVKLHLLLQFYRRRCTLRTPVASDPPRFPDRWTAEVDRESRPSRPSVNRHSDAAHCCFESDGISQGQEQRLIHFVLSPGPSAAVTFYIICVVKFSIISVVTFSVILVIYGDYNAWAGLGSWWEQEQRLDYTNMRLGAGVVTDVTCRDVSFVMCDISWHSQTLENTDQGQHDVYEAIRAMGPHSDVRVTRALFGDCESISPRVIVIVKQ